jgi:TolB-like protein/Flp pilus assembly protein TadD
MYSWLGLAHFNQRDYVEASEQARRAVDFNANDDMNNRADAYLLLAASEALLQRGEEARAALEQAKTLRPGLSLDLVADTSSSVPADHRRRYLDGLRSAGLAASGGDSRRGASGAVAETRIVVLPFSSQSRRQDDDEDVFAAGVTEEIRAGLGRIDGVGVIARSSSEEVARRQLTVAEVGRELGVSYVLDGTVQWGDDRRARIRPELVRVSDEAQVWRGNLDLTIEDLFEVQSEIAARIAQELDFSVLASDDISRRAERSAPAVRAYLRGRALSYRSSLLEALEEFETAVSLDPDFALAWAWQAETHCRVFRVEGDHSDQRVESAKLGAQRALALGPKLPETQRALGYLRWIEGRFDVSRSHFEKAVGLQPGDAETVSRFGYFEFRTGDIREGLRLLKRAVELDPLSTVHSQNVGTLYLYLKEFDEAESWFDRAIALGGRETHVWRAWNTALRDGWDAVQIGDWPSSASPSYHWLLFQIRLRQGRLEDAEDLVDLLPAEGFVGQDGVQPRPFLRARLQEARGDSEAARQRYVAAKADLQARLEKNPGDGRVLTTLGLTYAKLGQSAEAVRRGELALESYGPSMDAYSGWHRLYDVAAIHALVGNEQETYDHLTRLLEGDAPYTLSVLDHDPDFDSFKALPAYRRLVRSVVLP